MENKATVQVHENVRAQAEVASSSEHKPNRSFLSSLKDYPLVVVFSLGAHLSAILWGFDIGVNGITIALPAFKLVFGYGYQGELLISATWNALWGAMTNVGMLVGGLFCGWFSDYRGRRLALTLGSAISIVGVGIMWAASTPGVLLAAKMINGLALGFFLTLAPMYASEIAPKELRPFMLAAVQFFICTGQITAIGIGNTRFTIMTPDSYKDIFAAQWAFPAAVLILLIFMPESPWYLVRKDRPDDAIKSLNKLGSKGEAASVTLREISAAVEAERALRDEQKEVTYWDCFRGTNFRRTRIACGMFIVQQFAGPGFYAQGLYFLGIAGLPIDFTFQLTLAGFGVAMAANIASWFLMDYVGRRTLLLVGNLLNVLLLISIGIAGCFSSRAALYYVGYAINFSQLIYGPTMGACGWVYSAEISSAQMRAKTQSLATATNAIFSWAMAFIVPYLINLDEANLGARAAFVWVGLGVVSLIWVWFEVPEVKGRDFASLDILFEARTPTRKFKTAQVSTGSELADKLNES